MTFAREGTVVVYCEGGDCQSSLDLAKRLHEAGFRDIRVSTGGWDEWRAAGLPEEKSDAPE
jgi:rhodanese-related sulfurtransferase